MSRASIVFGMRGVMCVELVEVCLMLRGRCMCGVAITVVVAAAVVGVQPHVVVQCVL